MPHACLPSLAFAAGLLAACSPSETPAAPPVESVTGGRAEVRETLVVVESLSLGPVQEEVVVSARVQPRTAMDVIAKLPGLPVTAVFVEEGDAVKAGEVLMQLYDADLELAVKTARIAADEARRAVSQKELALDQSGRRVTMAERLADLAARESQRLESLGDLVSRKEFEDARSKAETSADDLELADFTRREASIALDMARIAADRSDLALEQARLDLDLAQVRCSLDGIVAQRNVDVGEIANTNGAAFRIVDTQDLILDLRVPQDALGRLAEGQAVGVVSVTDAGQRFEGRVRTVNPVLDDSSGTVHVIVDLTSAPGLVPGLFCEAHIVTSARPEALLVSKRAVLYEDDQPVIFAVDGDTAARRIAFKAGASTPTDIEILSDLEGQPVPADLRIVVIGQESLKDGSPVKIVEDAL